jgi:hypothetical protein
MIMASIIIPQSRRNKNPMNGSILRGKTKAPVQSNKSPIKIIMRSLTATGKSR